MARRPSTGGLRAGDVTGILTFAMAKKRFPPLDAPLAETNFASPIAASTEHELIAHKLDALD